MGAVAPMVTDVSQHSNPHQSQTRGACENHHRATPRLPNRLFLARYAHTPARARALLTIGRYWLFKRRIACAAGEPLELLRNLSGRALPAALQQFKNSERERFRAEHMHCTRGQLPPDPKDREGAFMDVVREH